MLGKFFPAFLLLILTGNSRTLNATRRSVLHITDIHYDANYDNCKTHENPRMYGEYGCDTNQALLNNALTAAKQILPDPLYVIWTGDTIPHKLSINDFNFRSWIRSVTNQIRIKYGMNTIVLPVLGSQDSIPLNNFPDEYCNIYKTAYSVWKETIGESSNATFLEGGFYKFEVNDRITVLGLNTNLYSTKNPLINKFVNKTDPSRQFEFIEKSLANVEANGGFVHIIAHIPSGASEHSTSQKLLMPEYNLRLNALIAQHAKVIKLIAFGHEHTDSFRIFKDPESDEPVQVGFITPSLSPNGNSNDNGRGKNPSFRIFEFDSNLQELSAIKTYFVNLEQLNMNNNVFWQLEYEMKSAYNMESLTVKSFYNLAKTMETDRNLYNKFTMFGSASLNRTIPSDYERSVSLCAIEYTDYENYDNCIARISSVTPTPNIGHILQFTDFHYDQQYSVNGTATPSQLCHIVPNTTHVKQLGVYGNYICDANANLIQNMLAAAKEYLPSPDFIIWTGDNFPHIEDYNTSTLESAMKEATQFVEQAFPNVLVLPTFGNHDFAPANAFPDKEHEIYRYVYDLWKNWLTEANRVTFLQGGYYKYHLKGNVTILVLNTNLYYRFNKAHDSFYNKTDPAGQFQFMIDNLENAMKNGEVVHVVAHIAPGVFERTPSFEWMFAEYNQKFIDITVRYASTIKWMIFGHHHTDTFHIVKDPDTGKAVQVYFMAPAVTPWFSTLPGAGSNNPAFRIYDYDKSSQELLDARTYYVDLDALNEDSRTKWQEEYSMKRDYSIEEPYLNADALNNVLSAIKANESLFFKYLTYNSVSYNVTQPLNETFKKGQLCSIEFPDYSGYDACMHSESHSTTTESSGKSSSAGMANYSTTTESGGESKNARMILLSLVYIAIRLLDYLL